MGRIGRGGCAVLGSRRRHRLAFDAVVPRHIKRVTRRAVADGMVSRNILVLIVADAGIGAEQLKSG